MSRRRGVARALGPMLILLAACGGETTSDESAEATKTVAITATEYSFAGDPTGIVSGDTVQFNVTNVGGLTHELQVLDPGGTLLGRTAEIEPGDDDSVVIEFAEAGDYRLICDIDDHQTRGQFAFITVGSG